MAIKFVKNLNRRHRCDSRQTIRQRYGEMCSYKRNRSSTSDCAW